MLTLMPGGTIITQMNLTQFLLGANPRAEEGTSAQALAV